MKNNNSHYLSMMLRLLILLDSFIFLSVFFYLTYESTAQLLTIDHITKGVIFAIILLLTCLGLGLYKSKLRDKFGGIVRRIFIAITISFVILNTLQIFIKSPLFDSEILLKSCFLSLVAAAMFRLFLIAFNILGFARRNVLVLGVGQRALIIEQRMRREVDRKGFDFIGFVAMPGDTEVAVEEKHIAKVTGNLVDFVLSKHVHEIVVATDERRENLPVDDLFKCKVRGVLVSDILDFIEKETGQIAVNLIYPSWVIYSDGFSSNNDLRNTLDWYFNAAIALVLIVLAWPIILIAYLAIKVEDGLLAPCFYWQKRIGLDGRAFNIVKFRSMSVNAENNGMVWASKNDPRVTKVGRFIRKFRIDELPQVYNIIIGDMGFVGPRPERPEFVQKLITKIPYYNERHNVKSGLTGWAQLKYPYGANVSDAQEKLKFDLYYIKHRSFMLDLLILIQTAEIILFGKGR